MEILAQRSFDHGSHPLVFCFGRQAAPIDRSEVLVDVSAREKAALHVIDNGIQDRLGSVYLNLVLACSRLQNTEPPQPRIQHQGCRKHQSKRPSTIELTYIYAGREAADEDCKFYKLEVLAHVALNELEVDEKTQSTRRRPLKQADLAAEIQSSTPARWTYLMLYIVCTMQ